MAAITVDVRGITEVRAMLAKFPDETFKAATVAMREATKNAKRTVQGNFKSYDGSRGGSSLHNRSGDFRRSVRRETSGTTLAGLFSRVYSDSEYASIHESGGTVRATNKYVSVPGGPYLHIPTPSNLSGSGIPIFTPGQLFATGGRIIKSRAGKWLVMSGKGVPMFVLVKSVTIPARLGMEDAVTDEIPTLLSVLNTELFRGL